MSRVRVVSAPRVVPVPGGKIIEEHVGRLASGDEGVSVAHMVAPPGWAEEPQAPAFDEVTVMVRGRMHVEIEGGETVVVRAGESLVVPRGVRVRYSNPFAEASEYWAICTPAFAVDLAGR